MKAIVDLVIVTIVLTGLYLPPYASKAWWYAAVLDVFLVGCGVWAVLDLASILAKAVAQ